MPEAYATYEDHKEVWELYELTGRKVIHLKAGDILMKKNFGENKEPGGLEGIISLAQKLFSKENRALQNANVSLKAREDRPDPVLSEMFPGVNLDMPPNSRKSNRSEHYSANRQAVTSFDYHPLGEGDPEGDDTGDWTTGHVAIAIDPVRLAEQTGTGVMINTLNVTSEHKQEHNVANVYYYVYRCNNKWIADNAARLAESFAASRPMNSGSNEPIHSKGNYTLIPASRAVLGRTGLRQRTYAAGQEIRLDKFSQNILDFCEGRVRTRSAMYCSAFVLAVYQAACVYTSKLYTNMNPHTCLLNLNPVYILPRHYEGELRQNKKGYTFKGTFRWKNLPYEKKAQRYITKVSFNYSQAIDNYANHVSVGHGARSMGGLHLTGIGKVSLSPTNRKLAEKLVENKKREMNDSRKAAHLAASRNSKFRAMFKKKDDAHKEATLLDALNELASLDREKYNNLYRLRQEAIPRLASCDDVAYNVIKKFWTACNNVANGPESLLQIHLLNAADLDNKEIEELGG